MAQKNWLYSFFFRISNVYLFYKERKVEILNKIILVQNETFFFVDVQLILDHQILIYLSVSNISFTSIENARIGTLIYGAKHQ